jgi:hypothetical protein
MRQLLTCRCFRRAFGWCVPVRRVGLRVLGAAANTASARR